MKIDKVLLIQPSTFIYRFPDGRPAHRKHCLPPLGLAYLAGSLRSVGIDVECIDMLAEGYNNEIVGDNFISYGMPVEDLLDRIAQIKPDLIGISVLFSNIAKHAYGICAAIKERFPDILLAMGGQHPTGAASNVFRHSPVDFILKGEADANIVSLVWALRDDASLSGIPNLLYRTATGVVDTMAKSQAKFEGKGWAYHSVNKGGLPKGLDDLPFPAWDLFPVEKYWACDVRPSGGDVKGRRYLVGVTSRGCPHICYFCTSPLQSGFRGYRVRSLDNVFAEIGSLNDAYGLEEFMFNDDNFFVAKPRAKKVLKGLAEKFPKIAFSVPGGTEVNALDDEMIELLAAANVHKLTLNVESPDPKIQSELIDKHVKVNEVPQKVAKLRQSGIETRAMIMIGFPNQTRASILQSIEYAKNLEVDDFMLSIVTPLPGTPLFDECAKDDLFIDGFSVDEISYALSSIKLPELSPIELEELRHEEWKRGFEARRKKLAESSRGAAARFLTIEEYENTGYTTSLRR